MNKEQEQIIDEVYENYDSKRQKWEIGRVGEIPKLPKEEFINKCKTDSEFSEKWGLKIEERELNHDERFEIYKKVSGRDLQPHITGINFKQFHFDEFNIPTKLFTLTYEENKIESYE